MSGRKAQIVSMGVGLGAVFGIVLGLLLFPSNFALCVPLGIACGFAISMIWTQQTDDDE